MTKRKMLGWGVCGALAIAFLSFFMDYLTIEAYGFSQSISGMKLLETAMDYMDSNGMMMVIAMVATVVALICALISNSKEGGFGLSIVCSIVAVVCMFILFSENDFGYMDYAGMGFWIFVIGHVASVILGFVAGKTYD